MNHFSTEEAVADLPVQPHSRAGRKLLHLARVEIEKAHDKHAGIVFYTANELALGSEFDRTLDDDAFNEHG